ncbi:hypothetical protein [Paraglaciecola chathamensis]|uniref:hypothetical protein n=1 Tax=Paraglaciecola chathamensis TaxID=368405 RepID=UPI0026FAAA8F|nr:hypothetical protein [Paraglaciecola chathamensis]MDO6559913.1 hypothetical protein [Paraglaciecola chathamensis]
MNEPDRIGLTPLASQQLDELLIELNPSEDARGETFKLIKFDIYRLAVALGIKENKKPKPLDDKSNAVFRVYELDRDKTLYTVVECLGVCPDELPIYSFIEQLAEQGIKELYQHFQLRGELPYAEYFADKA